MPWEVKKIDDVKRWYQRPLLWLCLAAVICGAFLTMPRAKGVWHAWREAQILRRGEAEFQRKDYRAAVLSAQQILARNPRHAGAARLGARALEVLNSPGAAEFRGQLASLSQGDTESLLALTRAALKAGNLEAATRLLSSIPPEGQQTAPFHGLAAECARRQHDTAAAEAHWRTAMQLDPAEDDYPLHLAALLLTSGDEAVRSDARKMLEEVAARGTRRVEAYRILLAEAADHGNRARAQELAKAIDADPKATFSDKLWRLDGLRAMRGAEFDAALNACEEAAASDPKDAFRLLTWMNEHNLALVAGDWVATMPKEFAATPPLCLAIADRLARCSEWERLRSTLAEANWAELEFLRLAFAARAAERLGDHQGSAAAWAKALNAAQAKTTTLESLGKTVLNWGWTRQAEEALWKLANDAKCPLWVGEYLWKAAEQRGDTAQLYIASRVLLQHNPQSPKARNNFIALSLLTGQTAGNPHELAVALFKEAPSDPVAVSTFAFSAWKQGHTEEAIAAMNTLPAQALQDPEVALYHGVFLVTAGRFDEAAPFIARGSAAKQLPEEKAMSEYLRLAYRAHEADRTGQAPEAGTLWNDALAAAPGAEGAENLAHVAIHWGWTLRAEPALLRMAAADRCPVWAAEALRTVALKSGDSSVIYKAAACALKADPKNLAARIHFATVALLTRHEGDHPQELAEALHRENPGDPEVEALYAETLLARNQPKAAADLLQALPPGQRALPRVALVHGMALAASGQGPAAEPLLQAGAAGADYPEEKVLVAILQTAVEAEKDERNKLPQPAQEAWERALKGAQERPDWLEMLGAMAVQSNSPARAQAALWRLADSSPCPAWAVDYLWQAVKTDGTPAERLKASKLRLRENADDIPARVDSTILALLIGQEGESPDRAAETLYSSGPGKAGPATAWALSLYLRGRLAEALAVFTQVPAEQMRDPRAALYYGTFLIGSGRAAEAAPFLRAGATASLFPEERSFLARIKAPVQLNALLPPSTR